MEEGMGKCSDCGRDLENCPKCWGDDIHPTGKYCPKCNYCCGC